MRHVAPISLPFSAACHTSRHQRGCHPSGPRSKNLSPSVSQCLCGLLAAGRQIPSFQQFAASCSLLPLFFALVSFVFSSLQTLSTKTGGWGGPIMVNHALSGRPAGIASLDRHANGGTPALLWKDELFGSESTSLHVVHLDLILFTALKSLPTLVTTCRLR